MHKEGAVKSRNKHLQCGPLCVELSQDFYFLRSFFSERGLWLLMSKNPDLSRLHLVHWCDRKTQTDLT